MGVQLQKRLLTSRFEGPHHEAVLNLMVAAGHIRGLLDEAVAGLGVTQVQYNSLRVLNGAYSAGYSRKEIERRMIER